MTRTLLFTHMCTGRKAA